jgi:alkyldihydroxyacetonephosphate synthase
MSMLSADLLESLSVRLGKDVVRTDIEEIARHSYDSWPAAVKWRLQGKQPYRPDVVVMPRSVEEISDLLRWANQNHVAVTPWGAGSSVTGAPLPLDGGISLDLSRLNRLIEFDETNLMVTVQAGMMGHTLEALLNERGCTLNHSPQSLDRSTVGGWVSTRATGQFSSRWGGIEDLVVALTVVLPTSEVITSRCAPRAAVGLDTRQVIIGAEGTLGVVAEVTLRVFRQAPYRRFEAVRFGQVEAGVTVMREVMQSGLRPFLVRYYDEDEAPHAMRDPAFDQCVMFLGFEGVQNVADAEYAATIDTCARAGGVPIGAQPVERWMERRFDFSTVENLLARPGGFAETIEVAHFWDGILPTYRAMKAALRPLADEVLGHFSHVYTHGTSLYLILLGQVEDHSEAEARIMRIWEVAMSAALEHGAAISHHHGVGIARLPYVQRDLGSSFEVMKRIKAALDPNGIMSPGKLSLKAT